MIPGGQFNVETCGIQSGDHGENPDIAINYGGNTLRMGVNAAKPQA